MRSLFVGSSLPLLTALLSTVLFLQLPRQVLAQTEIAFINPPPAGERNDKKNAIYPIGSTMRLQWNEDQSIRSSLVLFQVAGEKEGGKMVGGFEYVAPNHIQLTDYLWTVVTTKNLSVSNVFQLALFSNGATRPDAMSHYFNITSSSSSSPPPSPSASTTTSSGSFLTISLPTGTGTGSAGGQTTSTDIPTAGAGLGNNGEEEEKKGLSTGAAIGIGIGVSFALFLAIASAVGFWLFKVRRNKQQSNPFFGGAGGGHTHDMSPPPAHMGQTQPHMTHMAYGSPATTGAMGMSPDGTTVNGNGNGNQGYGNGNGNAGNTASGAHQNKDIFGGELQGNGPHGVSVYEIDSQAESPFAWDTGRARK